MARPIQSRCLHCGARLALYRKLTDAEFCSAAHRKAFQQDQTRLAMERLMETQQMCGRASEQLPPVEPVVARVEMLIPEPTAVDSPEALSDSISALSTVPDLAASVIPDVAPTVETDRVSSKLASIALPRESTIGSILPAPPPAAPALDPLAYDLGGDPVRLRVAQAWQQPQMCDIAGGTRIEVRPQVPRLSAPSCRPEPEASSIPAVGLPSNAARFSPEVKLPQYDEVQRLPRIDASDLSDVQASAPLPIESSARTWLPLRTAHGSPLLPLNLAPRLAAAQELPRNCEPANVTAPPAAAAALVATDAFIELPGFTTRSVASEPPACTELAANTISILKPAAAGEQPSTTLPEPSLAVGPNAATLNRSVLSESAVVLAGRPSRPAVCLDLPLREQYFRGPMPKAVEPPLAWALRGSDWARVTTAKPQSAAVRTVLGDLPALALGLAPKVEIPVGTGSLLPPLAARKAPANFIPADFVAHPSFPWVRQTPERVGGEVFGTVRPRVAQFVARSTPGQVILQTLGGAPLSVKLMAVMIPVLLFVAMRAPVSHVQTAAAAAPRQPAAPGFVSNNLSKVKTLIQNRAGIEMLDDFRMGLDNWDSRRDLTTAWSYDQTGFVRPGPLALYKPSMGLGDFDMEFLGQIDKRALGWVYRAQNLENYHVVKLVMLKSGPLPTIGLERYSVINGKETPHKTQTVPIAVHTDTIFRIRMEMHGNDYTVYAQNQLAGYWQEEQFSTGGVGFFSGRGEQSRIRWVQISHQYDAIGRLCAYFAPFAMASYNLQPSLDLQPMGAVIK